MIVRLKHNNELKRKPAKRNIRFSKTLCAIPPIGRPHIGFQSKRLSA